MGLPADTKMWEERCPVFMENTINACVRHNTKLVFFDYTYMYPQNDNPLTEETPFAPVEKKGMIRAAVAEALLHAMDTQKVEAVICRAPEFYGPGKTKGITQYPAMIIALRTSSL